MKTLNLGQIIRQLNAIIVLQECLHSTHWSCVVFADDSQDDRPTDESSFDAIAK